LSEWTLFDSSNYSVGRGNANTKLLTFSHAMELVMVLPDKLAQETRTKFANIIARYMVGDESLVGEIEANAQSASVRRTRTFKEGLENKKT
jgi:hypothetical protein